MLIKFKYFILIGILSASMLVFSNPDEIYFIENSLAMNDELRECGVSNNMSTQNIDGAGLDPDNISLLNCYSVAPPGVAGVVTGTWGAVTGAC